MSDEPDTSFPYELSNGVVLNAEESFTTDSGRDTYIIKKVFRDVSGLDRETLKFPDQDGTKRTYIGYKIIRNDVDPRDSPRSHMSDRGQMKEEKFVELLNNGEIRRET